MGTRADFYVGRGKDAEWLGSIAWDGHPDSLPRPVRLADDEKEYREAVVEFFAARNDVTLPAQGWPWPWNDSCTTDYAYAFDEGEVWGSGFGHGWWPVNHEPTGDAADALDDVQVEFPDMRDIQNVAFGENSGLIIIEGVGSRETVDE